MFPKLNLPEYELKLKKEGEQFFVFDSIRKKHIQLTPEEWVRQNFIEFLLNDKKIPKGLISVESKITLNGLTKRTDILVHSRDAKPLLIVECKSADIKINQQVFDQIARYNMVLDVKYLVLTNGLQHYCCQIDHANQKYNFIKDIPEFDLL